MMDLSLLSDRALDGQIAAQERKGDAADETYLKALKAEKARRLKKK